MMRSFCTELQRFAQARVILPIPLLVFGAGGGRCGWDMPSRNNHLIATGNERLRQGSTYEAGTTQDNDPHTALLIETDIPQR